MIGEAGLTTALHEAGYTLAERDPDYVVLGETRTYSFERITHAIRLINGGARFIATNPDPTGPSAEGMLPATGSVAALVSRATGVEPYFVGKPNPLMMRSALVAQRPRRAFRDHGDDRRPHGHGRGGGRRGGPRDDSGAHWRDRPGRRQRFPYRPARIVDSVADVVDEPAPDAGPWTAVRKSPCTAPPCAPGGR